MRKLRLGLLGLVACLSLTSCESLFEETSSSSPTSSTTSAETTTSSDGTTSSSTEDSSSSSTDEPITVTISEIPSQIVGYALDLEEYVVVSRGGYTVTALTENISIDDHDVLIHSAGTCTIQISDSEGTTYETSFEAVDGIKAKAQEVFDNLSSNYTFIPFATNSSGTYTSTLNSDDAIVHTENYYFAPYSNTLYAGFVKGGDGYFYRVTSTDEEDYLSDFTIYGGKYGTYGFTQTVSDLSMDVSDFEIEKDDDFNDVLVAYGTESVTNLLEVGLGLDATTYQDSMGNLIALDTLQISFEHVSGISGESMVLSAHYRYTETGEIFDGVAYYGVLTNVGTSSIGALDDFVEAETIPDPLTISYAETLFGRIDTTYNYTMSSNSAWQLGHSGATVAPYTQLTDEMLDLNVYQTNYYTPTGVMISKNAYAEDGTYSSTTVFDEGYYLKDEVLYNVNYDSETAAYSLGDAVSDTTNYLDLVSGYTTNFIETLYTANIVLDEDMSSYTYVIKPLGEEDTASINVSRLLFNMIDGSLGDKLYELGWLSQPVTLFVSSTSIDIYQRTYLTIDEVDYTFFAGVHIRSVGSTTISAYTNL